jgi:curved DNA-binding protein CbpA
MTDLYALLQVDPRADDDVVRAAYRTLARKHHPDAGGDAQQMAAINEAWAVLGNRKRRAAYDAKRTSAALATSPAEPTAGTGSSGSTAASATSSADHAQPTRARPPRTNKAGETVLDFGRYQGWTIRELARQDPYYLEWLERTPIGRPFKREIDGYLRSQPDAAAPTTTSRRRRWAFGG